MLSSIVQIHSTIHKILSDKAFTATDGLISQLFVVAFVHPTYVWIALIVKIIDGGLYFIFSFHFSLFYFSFFFLIFYF